MQGRPDAPEERGLVARQEAVVQSQHKNNHLVYKYTRAWNLKVWPIVVSSTVGEGPSDVHTSLGCVLEPSRAAVFEQRWMDSGGSCEALGDLLADIRWLHENYNSVPVPVKRRMQRFLSKARGGM